MPRVGLRRSSSLAAASILAAAAAAHVGWAFGASWPASSREQAGSIFAGTETVPGPAACLSVAGLLGLAAALAGGAGQDHILARAGRAGVVSTLALRGVASLTGNTEYLVPWKVGERFRETDRRYYGPGCLAVAALVAAGSS
jgi:Protein of unknown function (DUF3995)